MWLGILCQVRLWLCQVPVLGPPLGEFIGALADVPAVYFIMPTESNVARICEDLKKDLYGIP